jgi:hypothetical protein
MLGLVPILHDLCALRLRSFKTRVNIVDEDREALRLDSGLGRARSSYTRAKPSASCGPARCKVD